MFAVTVNINQLEKLRSIVGGMAKLTDANITKITGFQFKKETVDTIKASRSPTGVKWIPIRNRVGKPLIDTGKLIAGIDYIPTNSKAGNLVSTRQYSEVHNFGKTIFAKTQRGMIFKVLGTGGKQIWVRAQKVVVPPRVFMVASGIPSAWQKRAAITVTEYAKAQVDAI